LKARRARENRGRKKIRWIDYIYGERNKKITDF
jgi:hypothetical protein